MTSPGSLTHGSRYRAVAERLAAAHRRADPNIVKVYLALDPTEREIRLVEVTTEAPTTMEVLPFRFAATADVPFPSAVLLFSPEEWAARARREIDVPDGWENIEELQGWRPIRETGPTTKRVKDPEDRIGADLLKTARAFVKHFDAMFP